MTAVQLLSRVRVFATPWTAAHHDNSWCTTDSLVWPDLSKNYLRITTPALAINFFPKASARKLKPTPPRPRSLHERILEEIKAERKLRPVSPEETRRSRLGESQAGESPTLETHSPHSSPSLSLLLPPTHTLLQVTFILEITWSKKFLPEMPSVRAPNCSVGGALQIPDVVLGQPFASLISHSLVGRRRIQTPPHVHVTSM